MPELNEQQQLVHDQLVAFITGKDRTHSAYLLKGYAGTGKTFTIGHVMKTVMGAQDIPEEGEMPIFSGSAANSRKYSVAMSAPTNKAVRVLKKASKFEVPLTFATIHSLLGLQEKIDFQTGKVTFEPSKDFDEVRINDFNVLVIDEASMLADELFQHLVPFMNRIKIVFMGDPIQIPPVNYMDSIPFKEDQQTRYKIGVLELTDIVRQAAGNPILGYATEIRKTYKTGNVQPHASLVDGSGIEILRSSDEATIRGQFDRLFNSIEFNDDVDFMKLIAWRNATVDAYNKIIREVIYKKKDIPKIMVGERLIMDKPVLRADNRIILNTNDEVTVLSYEEDIIEVDFEVFKFNEVQVDSSPIKIYKTRVLFYDDAGNKNVEIIKILHESSEIEFNRMLADIKNSALKTKDFVRTKFWRKYFELSKKFAWVKYNYAITAHKSQGSTYTNCMVAEWDLDYNRKVEERNRIKYVSATRPKHRLIILK